MKNCTLLLMLAFGILFLSPVYGGESPNAKQFPLTSTGETVYPEAEKAMKMETKALRKAQKAQKKAVRKAVRKAIFQSLFAPKKAKADTDMLLLVIITILLPPLGVFLYEEEITTNFWVSLILLLLPLVGIAFAAFIGGIGYLLSLIFSLLVITDNISL